MGQKREQHVLCDFLMSQTDELNIILNPESSKYKPEDRLKEGK